MRNNTNLASLAFFTKKADNIKLTKEKDIYLYILGSETFHFTIKYKYRRRKVKDKCITLKRGFTEVSFYGKHTIDSMLSDFASIEQQLLNINKLKK